VHVKASPTWTTCLALAGASVESKAAPPTPAAIASNVSRMSFIQSTLDPAERNVLLA
jgi:hypothetical protein